MRKIIVNDTKFHTITFTYRLYMKEDYYQSTKRNILTSILSNSNKLYKEQYLWNKKLDSMYSMDYEVSTKRIGKYATLTYEMIFVHPKWIKDESYSLKSIYEFFLKIINNPLITQKTLKLAKQELTNELLVRSESTSLIANERTMEIYFKDLPSAIRPHGKIEEINDITINDIKDYFNLIMKKDCVFIATGDINESEFATDYNLNNFNKISNYQFTERNNTEFQFIKEDLDITQSVINIIYDVKIFKRSNEYGAIHILNYIFGIGPSSKLFRNVRESSSFCYSIHSSYIPIYGIIMVSAGINEKDSNNVIELIKKQMTDISLGDFDVELINEAIEYYENGIVEAKDIQKTFTENAFLENVVEGTYTSNELISLIKSVKLQDIKDLAGKINISFIHLYRNSR